MNLNKKNHYQISMILIFIFQCFSCHSEILQHLLWSGKLLKWKLNRRESRSAQSIKQIQDHCQICITSPISEKTKILYFAARKEYLMQLCKCIPAKWRTFNNLSIIILTFQHAHEEIHGKRIWIQI